MVALELENTLMDDLQQNLKT